MALSPIPEGYNTVNAMLVVKDPEGLISFLEKALGGRLHERVDMPDGKLMHAEVAVGNSMIMLGQAMGDKWPESTGTLYLYVEDADAAHKSAIAAGATSTAEPKDQFWGDRMAGFKDPNGINWWVSQRIEDVPQEELQRRMIEHMSRKEESEAQSQ